MRKLVKKYQNAGTLPRVSNPQIGYDGAPQSYVSIGSTAVNSNIGNIINWAGMAAGNNGWGNGNTAAGLGIGYAGSMLGNAIGGEAGSAIGAVATNLGQNIIKSGGFKEGLKSFMDLDKLKFGKDAVTGVKNNMSTFGTKDFKGFGNMGNLAIGIGAGILDRSAKHQRTSGKYGTLSSGIDLLGGIAGNFGNYGGYGGLGSLGMAISNKITGGTDGMTIADSLLGSSTLAGGLTSINPILGAAYVGLSTLNSATGKTTTENAYKDFMSREQLDPLWASYSKSFGDHKNALKYGGKKYGGLSRLTGSYGRADTKVRNDNSRLDTLMDIADRRELGQIRGSQMMDLNALDYRLNTFGGYDQYGTYVGKNGMKLPTKENMIRTKNIISMWGGGKYGKYNKHKNGEKCSTEHCATFSNQTIREQKDSKTGKRYTTYGDAWNLQDVEPVYSGYDESARPGIRTLQGMKMYSYNAADRLKREFNSNNLDKKQIYAVNMFYKNSPNWETAFKEGKTTTGTHTGYLYHDGKEWLVVHNIHNKIHVDPFLKIQGSGGNYGVTAIFKPISGKGRKTGLFGWGFLGLRNGGTIDSFKQGGQMSVIPEGALHARKNHMEGAGKDYTHKGIPVMDKNGEQQAEIERDEIIFSLRITQKLERLKNDGSDEAAIKAGRLLVDEIFHNTDDRTGLIAEVIGKDQAKKPVFKEGGILAEQPLFGIEAEEPKIEKFQEGGDIPLLDRVGDLPRIGPKVPLYVVDDNPRTDLENGIIYYNTPESKIHEYYGHYNPDQELINALLEYYQDLDDEKLQQMGADLDFVKRVENDPNYFYNPEELLARLQASRYMLGNQSYNVDPQFFMDLKGDELKYGENLRDLLHMYNPEILSQLFKISERYPLPRLQDGGMLEEGDNAISAEEPEIYNDDVEEFKKGGKTHWKKPKNWTEEKIPYEEWIKDVNPDYLSDNYDLEYLYNSDVPKEFLERWKWAVNSDDPEYYMNYKDLKGNYPYHLGSVIELDNGDIMFLKKGNINDNKELIPELMNYITNAQHLRDDFDLSYEGDRYYYRKKKPPKYKSKIKK